MPSWFMNLVIKCKTNQDQPRWTRSICLYTFIQCNVRVNLAGGGIRGDKVWGHHINFASFHLFNLGSVLDRCLLAWKCLDTFTYFRILYFLPRCIFGAPEHFPTFGLCWIFLDKIYFCVYIGWYMPPSPHPLHWIMALENPHLPKDDKTDFFCFYQHKFTLFTKQHLFTVYCNHIQFRIYETSVLYTSVHPYCTVCSIDVKCTSLVYSVQYY